MNYIRAKGAVRPLPSSLPPTVSGSTIPAAGLDFRLLVALSLENYSCAGGFLSTCIKTLAVAFGACGGGLLSVGSATAQQNTGVEPGIVDPGHPRMYQVNRREGRQQQRIDNGVKNGTLTQRQTARLENREANLQHREQRRMAKHNGHLTKPEQRRLNRQEDRIRSILRDKAKDK
jgi:hypothetical protein